MTDLVTTGVFTHMRNPIFTSMIIATVGFVLVVPSPVSIAALAFLVFALQVQTRFVEEPYLLTTHGQDYEDYVARTGRFFPRTTAPG